VKFVLVQMALCGLKMIVLLSFADRWGRWIWRRDRQRLRL